MNEIAILNVGAGDTKLSFDPKDKPGREHAKRVVQDMLKRGYAIMVQVGEQDGEPIYRRAKGFDPKTCEYIIMGTPDEEKAQEPLAQKIAEDVEFSEAPPRRKRGRPRKARETRVPAESTRAVSVARSAGG